MFLWFDSRNVPIIYGPIIVALKSYWFCFKLLFVGAFCSVLGWNLQCLVGEGKRAAPGLVCTEAGFKEDAESNGLRWCYKPMHVDILWIVLYTVTLYEIRWMLAAIVNLYASYTVWTLLKLFWNFRSGTPLLGLMRMYSTLVS